VVGAAGTAGTLWATGILQFGQPVAKAPSRDGLVAFPVPGRPLKAYQRVTRDDFANQETRQLNVIWMPKDSVDPSWERNLSKIVGRVMSRDKQPNMIFTEADFMPPGTREGMVAGIPPGKLALTIDAEQVTGLKHLQRGDHFDLMGSLPVNMQKLVPHVQWGLLQDNIDQRNDAIGNLQNQASVKVLAHDAVIVSHEQSPGERNKPGKHLVTIAVAAEEITPLTEALAIKAGIVCVARSGHPQDPGPLSRTPGHDPFDGMAFIENIRGDSRKLDVSVTKSEHHDQPVVATPPSSAIDTAANP
jgi:Flp pilus assembly protein CpaB